MTRARNKNKPALAPLKIILPHPDYPDHFSSSSSDSIDEVPEYALNLGVESPASVSPSPSSQDIPRDPWTTKPTTKRKSRDLKRSTGVDRDCGICFELAVSPCRTKCCGALFCAQHIAEWLSGAASDGCCPACASPCALDTQHMLSLAPPKLLLSPTKSAAAAQDKERVLCRTPTPPPPTTRPLLLLFQPSSPESAKTSRSRSTKIPPPPNDKDSDKDAQTLPSALPVAPDANTESDDLHRSLGRIMSIVALTLVLYVLLSAGS
ncbi:hypothetical protein BD779DRAFT_1528158 [Infundibulicybe gibba]|nr:hypothetical protein BD779DRAFT_1528158 [Infundibulicybe gibba]